MTRNLVVKSCETQKNRRVARIINVSKQKKGKCDDGSDDEYAQLEEKILYLSGVKYKMTIFAEFIVGLTVIIQIYLSVRYWNDPSTPIVQYTLMNIVFCISGSYIWRGVAHTLKLVKFNEYHTTDLYDIGMGVGLFILLMITQLLLKGVKLNVTAIDGFLFYVFSAPAEEVFFRLFLTAAPIMIGAKLIQKIEKKDNVNEITQWKLVVLKAIVATITGISFGIAHAGKYEGGVLYAVIVNGLELSFFYAFTKRFDLVLIAHLMVNISFGIQVYMTLV